MALYISDANGKLNKIAGNYGYDSTVEHLEVVYDMNSTNPNINWGYTNGINNGVNVTNKNFAKYKKLILYHQVYNDHYKSEIDLMKLTSANNYIGINTGNFEYDTSGLGSLAFIGKSIVNENKTSIQCFTQFVRVSNGDTSATNAYIVYKIEGVY